MKNLMVFISPTKSFDLKRSDLINDAGISIKVQIENSFRLGWKEKDIQLYTNFPFNYAGVNAKVMPDALFFERKPQASKINLILKLFERNLIDPKEIYWFHDLDAFQICSIPELEIEMEGFDMALTDYGTADRWSTGVIYFNSQAKDIFEAIQKVMYHKNIDEERALTILTRSDQKIASRVKKINKTFNFVPRRLRRMYALSDKPIKVLHFHPLGEVSPAEPIRSYYVFRGENSLGIQFIPDPLLKLFKYHRVS